MNKLEKLKHPEYGMFTTNGRPCEVCGCHGYNYIYPEGDIDYRDLHERYTEEPDHNLAVWNEWWSVRTMHLCDEHKEMWYDMNGFPNRDGHRRWPVDLH